jgi:hypothetical protein
MAIKQTAVVGQLLDFQGEPLAGPVTVRIYLSRPVVAPDATDPATSYYIGTASKEISIDPAEVYLTLVPNAACTPDDSYYTVDAIVGDAVVWSIYLYIPDADEANLADLLAFIPADVLTSSSISNYLPKTGGYMTGQLTMAEGAALGLPEDMPISFTRDGSTGIKFNSATGLLEFIVGGVIVKTLP